MEESITISALEPQNKKKDRYNLYIDGEYTASLGAQACVTYGIRPGAAIDEKTLREAVQQDNTQYAFDSAVHLLGFKMRTRHELTAKLLDKNIDPNAVEAALQKLEGYGYVDDAAYAKEFIGSAIAGGNNGKKVVAYKLKQKGVGDDIIEAALAAYTYDIETEIAAKQLAALRRRYAKDDPRKRRQKTFAALQRRGFTYDIINTLLSEEEED